MLKKLIDGGLPLADTFWKFGVLGVLTLNLIVKMFGTMLLRNLHGYTIAEYFFRSVRKFNVEMSTLVFTLLYLSSLVFLLFYLGAIIMGTWRSSAEYNRSLWFRHLARILILLIAFVTLKMQF